MADTVGDRRPYERSKSPAYEKCEDQLSCKERVPFQVVDVVKRNIADEAHLGPRPRDHYPDDHHKREEGPFRSCLSGCPRFTVLRPGNSHRLPGNQDDDGHEERRNNDNRQRCQPKVLDNIDYTDRPQGEAEVASHGKYGHPCGASFAGKKMCSFVALRMVRGNAETAESNEKEDHDVHIRK